MEDTLCSLRVKHTSQIKWVFKLYFKGVQLNSIVIVHSEIQFGTTEFNSIVPRDVYNLVKMRGPPSPNFPVYYKSAFNHDADHSRKTCGGSRYLGNLPERCMLVMIFCNCADIHILQLQVPQSVIITTTTRPKLLKAHSIPSFASIAQC